MAVELRVIADADDNRVTISIEARCCYPDDVEGTISYEFETREELEAFINQLEEANQTAFSGMRERK